MTILSDAVDHLVALIETPSTKNPEVQKTVVAIIQHASNATQQDNTAALQRMSALILPAKLAPASLIAIGCGTLIERGADPEIISAAILQRTLEALKITPAFGIACRNEANTHPGKNQPQGIEACVERYGQAISKKMPVEAQAWIALKYLSTAALAVLMRLPHARENVRTNLEFMTALMNYPSPDQGITCLQEVIQVLDKEEMIVLHPLLKKGYKIRIRGISRNFELHTLLADALIGNPDQGWLPGERPDARVVAAAKDGPFPTLDDDDDDFPAAEGAFNLWNWQGLLPDGTLPVGTNNHTHWIWNEGKPADIHPFEGTRIILLSPPPYARTWNAGRYFPGMKGEVEVLAILTEAQVDAWLAKITEKITQ